MKHDQYSYYCQCIDCWKSDVADQQQRVLRDEERTMRRAKEIRDERKARSTK